MQNGGLHPFEAPAFRRDWPIGARRYTRPARTLAGVTSATGQLSSAGSASTLDAEMSDDLTQGELSYVQAMDALLGYVGKLVNVVVGAVGDTPPVVAAMKGTLLQGEPDGLTKLVAPNIDRDDQVSYFAVASEHGHGIYVIRSYFDGASIENGTLVIHQRGVALRIFE